MSRSLGGLAPAGEREGLPWLHVVTDDAVLADPDFPRRADRVLTAGGADVALHLRGPRTSGRRLFLLVDRVRPAVRRERSLLLVNDRVDLALTAGVHGVHLGARSLPPPVARALLGENAWIGLSVHGEDEVGSGAEGSEDEAGSGAEGSEDEVGGDPEGDADEAGSELEWGADYLVVGTIFATPSHPDRPGSGPELLAAIRGRTDRPLLAIGGITPERALPVLEAGARGVAVLRGVWEDPDPGRAVERYLTALEGRETPDGREG